MHRQLQRTAEMECVEKSWCDWLSSDIDYAVNDRKFMKAGAGNYMNMISVIASKK